MIAKNIRLQEKNAQDRRGIAAVTLSNSPETLAGSTSAPVIAARNRLDIGAQTLNNGQDALMLSAGASPAALNIGGALDTAGLAMGAANQLNNAGGTIESLGGLWGAGHCPYSLRSNIRCIPALLSDPKKQTASTWSSKACKTPVP